MPHRSLSQRGFLVLMLAIGLVSFVTGVFFVMIGAWPVMGFFGLDVGLIWFAFRLNYRAARQFELVEIRDGLLTLMQVDQKGRVRSEAFNPYWVGVRLREGVDGRADLALASRGREYAFGAFLNDDEKRAFADLLQRALLTARGPRI
jgi:uncharacterized membrane protein